MGLGATILVLLLLFSGRFSPNFLFVKRLLLDFLCAIVLLPVCSFGFLFGGFLFSRLISGNHGFFGKFSSGLWSIRSGQPRTFFFDCWFF